MPTHNELAQYVARQAEQVRAERQVQAAVVREVGRRAQMVVDSPGWSLFVEHLQALIADAEQRKEATVAKMVEGDAVGDALTQLKVDMARLGAEIKALSTAVDLIPELIKRGQDAVDELGRR